MPTEIEVLERKIDRQQTLLNMYEDKLRLEDDPRRILKLQENIEEVKTLILGYQTQVARIRQVQAPPLPRSPAPTTFIANAPYGLETAPVGREDERLLLDDWFSHDEGHPLLAMIGLGGMGKSTLTWDWLQGLLRQQQALPLVVWWNCYETDGTMDNLMVAVLEHYGNDPSQFSSLRAAVMRFIEHLRRTPALLVLDGAERLLRAYSSLAAAYQGDEDDPAQREHARQCADPVTGQLLLWLAQPNLTQANTLLISRLFPLELAGRGGTGLQGVRRHDLTGLTPAAAYALFKNLRIRATRAEVEAVGEPLGYHPLSLRLLARTAADDPQYRNDIKAAVDYDPTLDLLGRRQHVLRRAYDTLPSSAQELLDHLATFPSSVAWNTIVGLFGDRREDIALLERRGLAQRTELRLHSRPAVHYDLHPIVRRYVLIRVYDTLPPSAKDLLGLLAAFRSSVTWDVIVAVFGDRREDMAVLERRGLVQRTELQIDGQPTAHYDLHPIVRRYAYGRLTDPTATHTQLVIYFEAVPQPDRVRTLDDLRPTIELYRHLIHAGRCDEAFELYRDRLADLLYFQLGAYWQCIELLRALFPDGEDQLPCLNKETDQAWTLNVLANSYSLAGQPAAAIPLFEQSNAIQDRQGNKRNLAIGLGNLAAYAQRPIGALRAAADNLRQRIALCREIEDRSQEAVGHQELGRVLAYDGDWAGAKAELEIALKIAKDLNEIQNQGLTWAYRALAALLQGQADEALTAAQEALRLADEWARTSYPVERDYVRCYWLLGWASLAQGQLDTAQTHLDEALRRCRAINLVEFEPAILLAQARLALAQANKAQENPAQAKTLAEEARLIAERAGYRLDLADIHNLLAQLALADGDRAAARDHAQQAKDYALCDGPPYSYQVAYDEAERLLQAALGG